MSPRGAGLTSLRARLRAREPAATERPGAAQAAVAVILAEPSSGGTVELLLIRRAVRAGDPWSGQMGLPGGRREAADEDLLDTAVRETREETAIDLRAAPLLGRLDDLSPITRILPAIVVRPFVFGLDARPAIRPNVEIAAHRWVPLADLAPSEGPATIHLSSGPLTVPAYRLGRDVVWGMTHRILMPLVALFAETQ